MMHRNLPRIVAVVAALAVASSAHAQVQLTVSDDFTQARAQNQWATFDGACLTAGDGTGSIPPCIGLQYYQGQTQVGGTSGTLPDQAGAGALRLTNGFTPGQSSGFTFGYKQAGGIISNFTFAAGTGVQILFKTLTYRGDSGGNGGGTGVDQRDGADGMSFFLIDATDKAAPYDMGAFGGSLGYTCSNRNNDPTLRADGTPRQYDGLLSGYIGLGIDEFGNFLNPGDNTATGPGLQAGRIGLRGAGSISWKALNSKHAALYPSSLTLGQQAEAVNNTCKTGMLWDYSRSTSGATVKTQTTTAVPDYADLGASTNVPATTLIANEAAVTRSDATPIAYQLKITQDGLLSFSYSYNGGAYQSVITDHDITASNGKLPAQLRFGFAGSTGGDTNVHEILCFQANPTQLADTSVGVNQKAATQIGSGTQAFLAMYFPNDWWGSVTASNLLYDATTQQVLVSATANWDASCVLTGAGPPTGCASTGAASVTAQAPANRTILTWNGTQGVPFQWTLLSDAERAALDPGVSSAGAPDRLNYLRGDRSNEITSNGGKYRARISVLGDVIDASPTWVGPPNNPYTLIWKDLLYPNNPAPENGMATYAQFVTSQQTRQNVVYAGSNDGFLHGFRAGGFDANGNFVTTITPNDGFEVLAYMPGAVVSKIHNNDVPAIDYSNSHYAHAFFVDAPPATDDLFYGGAWHTWLVGGLGAGGSAIYMLDVTDPTQFSEANAATLVIGEWTPNNLNCAAGVRRCGRNLGNTYGVPVIRRLHNGDWGVIFGNGYGSTTGDAGIFIMTVNPTSGARTFYYLSTGQQGTRDGIASPSPADYDGDHITDYVYAGDLLGNVWRFDLTSSDPAQWAAAPAPLFTDPAGQPITTKLTVGSGPVQGVPRAMIDFGTGMKTPLTVTSPAVYSSGTHTLYGIWDWNMSVWNSKSTARLDSLNTPPGVITLANLTQQTLTPNSNGDLDGSSNTVCWADQATCASTPSYGWYINLGHLLEQVIFNPVIYQNALLVNTTVPANNPPFSCKNDGDTGYTIAVALDTGAAIPGLFPLYGDTLGAGSLTNNSGSPFIVMAGGQAYMLTQTVGNGKLDGPIACAKGSLLCDARIEPQGPVGKRLTWIQRR